VKPDRDGLDVAILARLERGDKPSWIALALHVGHDRVRRVAREHGLYPGPKRGPTYRRDQRITELWKQGLTTGQIGEQLGLTAVSVARTGRLLGLPGRPPGNPWARTYHRRRRADALADTKLENGTKQEPLTTAENGP